MGGGDRTTLKAVWKVHLIKHSGQKREKKGVLPRVIPLPTKAAATKVPPTRGVVRAREGRRLREGSREDKWNGGIRGQSDV